MKIVDSILKSADWRARAWYLERTDPEQYARSAERPIPVDLSQPVAPVECHIIVRQIGAEERALTEELMQHPEPPPAKKQNALGSNGINWFTRSP